MKTKRYDDGGYTGDDPIVKYRMGMIDDKGNDITKSKQETSADLDPYGAANRETSADLDPYGAAGKKPASVERTVVKTKVSTEKPETSAPAKKNAVEDLKKVVSPASMPKSFKESGGNTTPKKSTASMPSMKISLPDPLAQFDSKGKRYSGRDIEDRKKGGAIKKMAMGGTASKRGDGIAMRGKTRGKMC
jgi:hypothetical protein